MVPKATWKKEQKEKLKVEMEMFSKSKITNINRQMNSKSSI
jgi:hypothetical protein